MIVIFCGDRLWNNFKVIEQVILSYPPDLTIVEGDCRGADKISGYLGRKHGRTVIPEPADWIRFPTAAGPIRNRLMIKKHKPVEVVAFHNNINTSKGTKDMINASLEAGLSVKLYNDKGECMLISPKQQKLM